MSVNTTPDAWKEMCQLLETRKQVLDNALVRTLDDKCSASHFHVVRSLMLDHERLLHWFITQQSSGQDRGATPAASDITKPLSPLLTSPAKRAGFIKLGLLTLLALVFFFFLVLAALVQGHLPTWGWYDQNTEYQCPVEAIPHITAHDLHKHEYGYQQPRKCCIMEKSHDCKCKYAHLKEMDDASSAARSPHTHQNCIAPCDQAVS